MSDWKSIVPRNTLAEQLAIRIRVDFANKPFEGDVRLVERQLAEQYKVSRSPIRNALKLLAEQGIVRPHAAGGYSLAAADVVKPLTVQPVGDDEEARYFAVVNARLADALPDRITENELQRRFGFTKGQLAQVLRRIASEGWIERLPGHGWAFLPVLTSMDAYRDSYRFRLTIEPAALLEPDFKVDRAVLEARLAEQQQLAAGDIDTISAAELFELNSQLHEAVVACSGNMFFTETLKRINRLRRLMEYKQALERDKALQRIHEHIVLLNLLLDGKIPEAAQFLRRHLQSVTVIKSVEKPQTSLTVSDD